MPEQHDPFFAHRVDESLEQLAAASQADTTLREQTHVDPDARLVHDLHKLYSPEHKRYQRALQRVEERLVAQRFTLSERASDSPVKPVQRSQSLYSQKIRQGSFNPMKNTPSSETGMAKFGRRVSLLVATLVMIALVGSLVMVLNFTHRPTSTGSRSSATSTPTPVPSPTPQQTTASPVSSGPRPAHEGTVVYTSPASFDDYYAFAWSPDSQRVAASTQSKVQIWDAITGKHPLTFTPSGSGGSVLSLAWSPNGHYLAVASGQVQIIDPKTGAVVRSFPSQVASLGSSASPYLSSAFPSSGGNMVYSTAWSPDGSLMASALNGAAYGNVVVVWNPSNGQIVYTFHGQSSDAVNSVSWSADGKYIASASYGGTVQVWDAHTGKVIFNHAASTFAAWAPGGMLLAFSNNLTSSVQVWNVVTDREIANYYSASQPGALVWSPDGKEIAMSSGNNVAIWDVATDKAVYLFTKQSGTYVRALAWSPNGKYIVSGSGNEGGGNHATVWVA